MLCIVFITSQAYNHLLTLLHQFSIEYTRLCDCKSLHYICFEIGETMLIFYEGRSGRAGRTGEAITLYTEEDVPYLRNIANVMRASGCEVPSWILTMSKKKWKKHRPKRECISTTPKDERE